MAPLRVGFVPEHFSTPLHFAQKHFGLAADLIPFPSGTGHMITALRSDEIDVGIGLTEAWVAGLGKETEPASDGGYRLIGTYVESPLCWAVSTGSSRPEITSLASLEGSRLGVSRIGSGSYVMGFVLADHHGWLSRDKPYAAIVPLDTFRRLREGVNSGAADFFMWEHFTSKKFHDAGEIRRVGDILTPWSSWKIVASTRLLADGMDGRVGELLGKLDQGIAHFNAHHDEAVEYISTQLDYTAEDAREWLKTVRYPVSTRGVRLEAVDGCVGILRKAGVLGERGMPAEDMIFDGRV